jgi:hypothetical protein
VPSMVLSLIRSFCPWLASEDRRFVPWPAKQSGGTNLNKQNLVNSFRISAHGSQARKRFYGKHPGGRCQSLGYGGVICPAAWQAAQWGRTSIRKTHRPNSGTRPTRQETAFQRQSGVVGPPLASLCCGGSPGTRRTVRRDRSSDLPGSAGRSLTATQQTAPSRSSRLVFQKPALVGLNPVVIPPKPLPSSGRWRRCSAPAGISSAACATGRPGRSEQFPATATAEMQCYRKSATRRRCLS